MRASGHQILCNRRDTDRWFGYVQTSIRGIAVSLPILCLLIVLKLLMVPALIETLHITARFLSTSCSILLALTAMLIGLLWIAFRIFQSLYEGAMEKRRQYSFARDMHHATLDDLWKIADATYSTNVLAIPQTLRHGETPDKCVEHRTNTWRRLAFVSILALLLIPVLSIDDPAAQHMKLIVEFVSSLSKLISVFL